MARKKSHTLSENHHLRVRRRLGKIDRPDQILKELEALKNYIAHTDEALSWQKQVLEAILQTTADGMLLLDLQGRVRVANPALAHYLRIPQQALEAADLASPVQKKGPPFLKLIGYDETGFVADCRALENREQEMITRPLLLADHPQRHIERTLAPVWDEQGGGAGWLLVFHDTSEEVELSRLRDEMTHMLIHDLRSPLATLASSFSLLSETIQRGSSEDVPALLELSRRGTERMLDLVNELLEINKLESGEAPLQLEPVSIKSLLEDIAWQFAPLAKDASIELIVEADEYLPEPNIDSQQMGRVISNLVDNAIKFTPNGGKVRLWSSLDPGDSQTSLLVGVSDTGPGIPEEARVRIFEKFQRVTTIKGRRLGTGLGLAFCKLAVESHGGSIWVENNEGQGSTFTIRLPLA